MDIIKIQTLPNAPIRKRVVAYARVSKEKESMIHSLNAQVSYYSKYIQRHKGWKYAGVYADEGISGTRTDRPEFNRMMEDAREKKFEIIITKSISRFARNTVALLNAVRELKRLDIDVYFEEQNIHSISYEGEIMLTILATTAEEEAKNMSEHMHWRIEKDMEQGLLWGGNSPYGYNIEKRKFSIVPEEARVVRMMFDLYKGGMGDTAIAKYLNNKGIKPKKINRWTKTTVRNLLINITYTGDLILQKTYRPNCFDKKWKINKDARPKYHVKKNHEGIISRELYQECLYLRAQRTPKNREAPKVYPFTRMIKCGCCGSSFHHKVCLYQDKWMCKEADKMGRDYCTNKAIPERVLYKVVADVLGLAEFDEAIFKAKVKEITAKPNNLLEFYMKDGSIKEVTWTAPSRKESWTPEMREQARLNEERRLQCLKLKR